MKKLTLLSSISAIALLFSASGALAAACCAPDPASKNNIAYIDQTRDGTGAHDYMKAEIKQTGHDQEAAIEQHGFGGHDALIKQKGDMNYAGIKQGEKNDGSDWLGAEIEQDGVWNRSYIDQKGLAHQAKSVQIGDDNQAYIKQRNGAGNTGHSSVLSLQKGDNNYVDVDQAMDTTKGWARTADGSINDAAKVGLFVEQNGNGNTFLTGSVAEGNGQQGKDNHIHAFQDGDGHVAFITQKAGSQDNSAKSVQYGAYNNTSITQAGKNNKIDSKQTGGSGYNAGRNAWDKPNNLAVIDQAGEHNSLFNEQNGTDNKLNAKQRGINNTIHNFQDGTRNIATIDQDSDYSDIRSVQYGTDNNATITQRAWGAGNNAYRSKVDNFQKGERNVTCIDQVVKNGLVVNEQIGNDNYSQITQHENYGVDAGFSKNVAEVHQYGNNDFASINQEGIPILAGSSIASGTVMNFAKITQDN
jgi:hypothetical protein